MYFVLEMVVILRRTITDTEYETVQHDHHTYPKGEGVWRCDFCVTLR